MRGSLAEFYLEPMLLLKDGKLAQPGVPSGHFLATPSGSQIALDDASLQAATLYAHLEKLNELDQASGAAESLPKHSAVGLNVGFVDKNNNVIENNAQYTPSVDAILFLPYTQSELPITLNAGVIAHEHFHSLFHHIVLMHFDSKVAYGSLNLDESERRSESRVPAKDQESVSIQMYNRYLLRGVNEGLADFWGWIYSGDENFVGRSIPAALEARRLDKDDSIFFDLVTFKYAISQNEGDGPRVAHAYSLGTQYAVYLRNTFLKIYKKNDIETRAKMAKILVQALFKFKIDLEKRLTSEYLPPEIFMASFFKALTDQTKELGTFDICKSYQVVAPFAKEKLANCEAPDSVVKNAPDLQKPVEQNEK